MKAHIRIPTKTQYAFIEAEVEGTPREIVGAYNELSEAYWGQKSKEGLPENEWNKKLDEYLWGDVAWTDDTYSQLSAQQLKVVQEIKRSKKRMNYKLKKEQELQDKMNNL